MPVELVIGSMVAFSAVAYGMWVRAEKQRETKASHAAAGTAELGDDAVAASLHPVIDPQRCIGSGACVAGCPEKMVIGLIGGQAALVNPLGCVGHGACERACPVGAIKLVYGTKTRGVELPRLDTHYQTSRKGVYVIGELGGMGLIRNAIRQGAEAAERIIKGGGAEEPIRRGSGDALDAIVVGAGPAGISATLAMMEANLRVLLLDRETFGGTIMHYPRGKVTMTGDLPFPMYGRVRRRKMAKEELMALWDDIRSRYNPPVKTGVLVEALEYGQDDMWTAKGSGQTFRAANVLLALGLRGSPRKMEVPGEEQAKVAYRLLEPSEFKDKHVLVVGGGNSAVESALALSDYGGCKSVGISYRRTSFARCRGENRARIEEAMTQGAVSGFLGTQVLRVESDEIELAGDDKVPFRTPNNAVIVQIGGTPPGKLLRSFGIETVTKFGER